MMTLVKSMKSMVDPQSYDFRILERFVTALDMIIQYLDVYLNSRPLDAELLTKLKSIIVEHHGSGSSSYSGWYAGLFHNIEENMDSNPEVSSFFTGVADE